MGTKIEFRVKQEKIDWEDTPVAITVEIDNLANITDFANRLSKMSETKIPLELQRLFSGTLCKCELVESGETRSAGNSLPALKRQANQLEQV